MREFLPLHHPRAEPTRGAGLRALALIAGGWVTMRAFFIIGDDGEVRLRPIPSGVLMQEGAPIVGGTAPLAGRPTQRSLNGAVGGVISAARLPDDPSLIGFASTINEQRPIANPALSDNLPDSSPDSWNEIDRDYMGQLGPLFLAGGTSEMPEEEAADTASAAPFWLVPPIQTAPATGQFSLYAYLFFRPDAASGASATTYGGSQMFVRADWRLGQNGLAQRSHLYARVSREWAEGAQAEFALGGAVQPFARLPVILHGERRIRTRGPDATAAFVSGGVSDVALPHGIALNAYGQGGTVWPDQGRSSQFFDGQAVLSKPLRRAGPWQIDAGALAATGGQDDTARLDIGPVVTVSGDKGGAQVQGQAGWRFRIAGDAAPANGPAVTLSVRF